jgi:hypothetical protein
MMAVAVYTGFLVVPLLLTVPAHKSVSTRAELTDDRHPLFQKSQ